MQLYNDATHTTATDAIPVAQAEKRKGALDHISLATREMPDNVWVDTKVAEDRQRNGAGKSK